MASIRTKLRPEDFQIHAHYWNTFGSNETEVSAYWVVKFLRDRNAKLRATGVEPEDNGWASFTYAEINAFYNAVRKASVQASGKTWFGDGLITFNNLILTDTRKTGELNFYSDTSLTFEKVEPCESPYEVYRCCGNDRIVITDRFICRLASSPDMFKTEE